MKHDWNQIMRKNKIYAKAVKDRKGFLLLYKTYILKIDLLDSYFKYSDKIMEKNKSYSKYNFVFVCIRSLVFLELFKITLHLSEFIKLGKLRIIKLIRI